MEAKEYPLGIDLGTTYCCMAIWDPEEGRAKVIKNNEDKPTMPSCVGFTQDKRLVGHEALRLATDNAANTIFGAKRLIGRKFDDEAIRKDIETRQWHIDLVDKDKMAAFRIEHKGKERIVMPEEVSAYVLQRLVNMASEKLGREVKEVIITIPAYFTEAQRQATMAAALAANLNVRKLLSEPMAAALAFGFGTANNETKTILVYDLGGGTFDVCVMRVQNDVFTALAVGGDPHLGGEDFDNLLVNLCVADIRRQTGRDVKADARAFRRLKEACEAAKVQLSEADSYRIVIDNLLDDFNYSKEVKRDGFERLIKRLVAQTIESIQITLAMAGGMDEEHIDEVLLVGGSSRIPFVEQELTKFFKGKKMLRSVHPDEAIAIGAATYGYMSMLPKEEHRVVEEVIREVTPLGLGIDTAHGLTSFIIEANTTIPVQKSRRFETSYNNQTLVEIPIYEGFSKDTERNHLLAKFQIKDIPSAPKGEVKVDITLSLNADGLLTAHANCLGTDLSNSIEVRGRARPSDDAIEAMRRAAEEFREEEALRVRAVKERSLLETYVYGLLNDQGTPDLNKQQRIKDLAEAASEWIDESSALADPEALKAKREQVYNAVKVILLE